METFELTETNIKYHIKFFNDDMLGIITQILKCAIDFDDYVYLRIVKKYHKGSIYYFLANFRITDNPTFQNPKSLLSFIPNCSM